MIGSFLAWYLALALAGALALPIAFRLLPSLPERGASLARPLGLLLWGYIYWLLCMFGVLQNNAGGVLFALLVLAGLSAWALRGNVGALVAWLRENRRTLLTGELFFLLAFAVMTLVRAAIPEASGTEKPMELAFINAILRSPAFPPADPWLSGYAISYYYFGYVIVAMLAAITGLPGAVAFNLAIAAWFALAGLAAFGLLYSLLAHRSGGPTPVEAVARPSRRLSFLALLAPLFLLLVSNLGGLLEALHARGLFWQQDSSGAWTSSFWQWLNIQELVQPPTPPFSFVPERVGGWWWWRASRVLQDVALDGSTREVIDEFPAFSFLLGDLHPHVLAMPFALLAAGLALNTFFRHSDPVEQTIPGSWLRSAEFWLAALVLGGLAFLNTWDFPIYLALFAAALLLVRYLRGGWRWRLVLEVAQAGLALGAASIALYLPFYVGFSSQAGGLLPSLVFFTRGAHFWVMFASLLLPILGWLVWRWRSGGTWVALAKGFGYAAALVGGLWLISSLSGVLFLQADPGLAGTWGATPDSPLASISILLRLRSPGAWLSLLGLLALAGGLLLLARCPREGRTVEDAGQKDVTPSVDRSGWFVLLLVLTGTGLVLFPEFFYLRDQFGYRMNTIFKFYFQAWILWSLAAAYASATLLRSLRGLARPVFTLGWTLLVLAALIYPLAGVASRTNGLRPTTWSLDGSDYLRQANPGEMEAIDWLRNAPYGTLAEAIGGSYTGFARVSTFSGEPTVLGWPGHESQWRGGALEMGSRQQDIEQLYRARNWQQASAILERYGIRYVFIGSLERGEYRPDETLFRQHLSIVFENDRAIIFEVPGPLLPQAYIP